MCLLMLLDLKWAHEKIPRRGKTLLFLCDNHCSNLQAELADWALLNTIKIKTFPPSTTHILQPCDLGLFGPVKQQFVELLPTMFNEAFLQHSTPGKLRECWAKYSFVEPPVDQMAISSLVTVEPVTTVAEVGTPVSLRRLISTGVEITHPNVMATQ